MMQNDTKRLYKIALWLSIFTIAYNLVEGLVSILAGAHDETLTLFGFGIDSIIEVVSGIGIYLMIRRIQQDSSSRKSGGEIRALRITGISFYVLVAVLILSSVLALISHHHPVPTTWGIFISLVSILIMLTLARMKIKTGKALNSTAIIADGNCTMVCVYMSVILLVSSALYYKLHLAYIDSIGSLALCWFCVREGSEALESAKHIEQNGCC